MYGNVDLSSQIIATSHDLTLRGILVPEPLIEVQWLVNNNNFHQFAIFILPTFVKENDEMRDTELIQ